MNNEKNRANSQLVLYGLVCFAIGVIVTLSFTVIFNSNDENMDYERLNNFVNDYLYPFDNNDTVIMSYVNGTVVVNHTVPCPILLPKYEAYTFRLFLPLKDDV